MTTLREAAQMALEALEKTHTQPGCEQWQDERRASIALRTALAEPEKEPVAYLTADGERVVTAKTYEGARRDGGASWSSMQPYVVRLFKHSAPQLVALTEERERCARLAEGWACEAADDAYQTSGNGRFWDAGTQYDQGRTDAAADIRSTAYRVKQEGNV